MRVAGVDGCRGGWIALVLDSGGVSELVFRETLAELVALGADVVAVDIPIGLPRTGTRRLADVEARRFVGPRRSSVFFAPPADVLALPWDAARAHGVSKQAYALKPRIGEAAALADRILEVHPEVSFRAMAGEPLEHAKKTWPGLMKRLELLHSEGIELPTRLADPVPIDDVVDAGAAAWSARRYASGRACSLPSDGERIGSIWY